jgi:uncharacterized membrane protein
MVPRVIAVCFLLMLPVAAAEAQQPAGSAAEITGLFVTTRYPALTVRAGEATTVDVSVRNFRLPPQRLQLSVPEVADGWKATILGGGQPVGALEIGADAEERLQLRLEPPADIGTGVYQFTLQANNAEHDLQLPIMLTIGEEVPAQLALSTNFPALRGTATTSFKYRLTVKNDSGRDATVNLAADSPRNFQVNYTEAFGSQQITSIPIEAGSSKDVEASLSIPRETPAGEYNLVLRAQTEAASAELPVNLTIVGQPRLAVSGEGGRLSGEAYAGRGSELTVVLRNDGTEAARDVEVSASTPEGWQSSFDPRRIAEIPAGGTQNVTVTLTPSERAIAGDYQTTIRAGAAGGLSESANFRITVLTSTLWGAVGIAIIAISLLIVVFAVARFGRR